jgi:hypothetical protein
MMMRIVALACAGLLLSVPAQARQTILTPSDVLRVVNPEDAGDVRVLIRFEIPEEVARGDILAATLRIETAGTTEIPFCIGPLGSAWSRQDDWTSLGSRLEGSPGFEGDTSVGLVMTNHLEPSGSGSADLGVEAIITPWVREWAQGANHGIILRSVAGRDDDLSGHLPATRTLEIELVILYMNSLLSKNGRI